MNSAAAGAGRLSKRLILSYLADWIVIILIAIVGALFTKISPNRRPFSLVDASISYPYKEKETISTVVLSIVSLVVPAVIIFFVSLLFVPGPTLGRGTPKSLIWRRKLWEWNTGWMGLALACAGAFFLTDGMKALFGKPRPDLLSRCNPDLANAQKYAVGGYGDGISEGILLVSWHICRQKNMEILNDGFYSFPSGHSSLSWAGLTYLTLFLCSKFAVAIPFLAPRAFHPDNTAATSLGRVGHRRGEYSSHSQSKDIALSNLGGPPQSLQDQSHSPSTTVQLRNQAAAPPAYLLVIAFIPIGAAIYISSTRYSDFRHHGFDIIFGSLMGFALAWFSFRWYHLPIRQGAGWSWGARSRDRAFAVPVGVHGYVGYEGWENAKASDNGDIESGRVAHPEGVTGAGGLNGTEQTQYYEPQNGAVGHRGVGATNGEYSTSSGVRGAV